MNNRLRIEKQNSGVFLRMIAARIGQALLAAFGVSVLVWALLLPVEGDTAEMVLKARGVENPSALQIQAVRDEFGLDKPFAVQYFLWFERAMRGDFSISYQSKRPVLTELAERLPATVLLASVALLMSLVFSISGAMLCAAFHGKLPDRIIQFLTQVSSAVPPFLLGLLILQYVVVGSGVGSVVSKVSISGAIFPAFCLAAARFGSWTQVLRAGLLEALNSRYALVAKARGASDSRILWRYALPNALLPFLTIVGVGVGSLLGGAAIIETVFSWNGVGSRAVQAVAARDLPVIQGFVIFATLAYITANLAVDLFAMWLDPRLRAVK
jgi:ABC-type dipeptide/oligopeptide/nickel transport systems, permease components